MGFTDSDSALALGPIFQTGRRSLRHARRHLAQAARAGRHRHVPRLLRRQRAGGCRRRVRARQAERQERSICLRDNSTEYTTLLAKYFKEAFTKGGGTIVARGRLQVGDKSFTAQITKLKALSARSPTCSTWPPCPTTSAWSSSRCARRASPSRSSAATATTRRCCSSVGGKAANDVYYLDPRLSWRRTARRRSRSSTQDYKAAYGTPTGERLRRARL